MRKKGFTLIELLAVIVILAIIALISVPLILNVIADSKKGAFKSTAYGIIEAAELEYAQSILKGNKQAVTFTYTDGVETSSVNGINLNYKGTKPKNGTVSINSSGEIAIAIHDGKYCAKKGYDEERVTISEKNKDECKIVIPPIVYQDETGAPIPELADGMIPIKWDGSKWVKANIYEEWYDYSKKEWANAVLVTESSRNLYKLASPDTEINEVDVLAYLVWIPRYRYKLFNVNSEVISPQEIEIVFESKNVQKSTGSNNGEWLTHPAFTFGSDELNGIWVGKFETTGNLTFPTIKPGIAAITRYNVSTYFVTAQKFNDKTTYGLSSNYDAHMMKNMEWGAVAYLSHSKYGKNEEIWLNPSNDYITGCAGSMPFRTSFSGCQYHYTTNNGMQASTTGNIYGIYDMVGGSLEYVMGAMYNSDNVTIMIGDSGFAQEIIDSDEMSKYIDKYTYAMYSNQNNYYRRKLGDATSETRGWYDDADGFVESSYPWFSRGNHNSGYKYAGVFSCNNNTGGNSTIYSFRLAITSISS